MQLISSDRNAFRVHPVFFLRLAWAVFSVPAARLCIRPLRLYIPTARLYVPAGRLQYVRGEGVSAENMQRIVSCGFKTTMGKASALPIDFIDCQ